ncbi:MAG TPA: adenine deaminase C-terminal domain-containing protein [Bacillales bacterium]|nr:adenine deaminase C-terminal domain-containing protein [Bacillales bacterium]
MPERNLYWTKKQLRGQLAIVRGEQAPTKVLKDATYLNMVRKKWMHGHIWIAGDRIVYVGQQMPKQIKGTEIIDCSNRFVVPGYFEPHAHPFQLYNPHTLAQYASVRGTTTMVCDSLVLLLRLTKRKAFSIINELGKLPVSLFWWGRYDAQTELNDEEDIFSTENVHAWLNHPAVIQGGELTDWPKVLAGDDEMLDWMQMTTRLGKPIEGHLPGASEGTLTQMALLGVNADHEAMTGEEVERRMNLGYSTVLRYSSIRPDLPVLLEEMKERGIDHFERVYMTTDGSTPAFYGEGVIDRMIEIALEKGVSDTEAYAMGSYNAARHYGLDHRIGMIAPGRLAHLNILKDKTTPNPESVLAKGEWIRRGGKDLFPAGQFSWKDYDLMSESIDWSLNEEDFQFSLPVGMEMVNSVITKPYHLRLDPAGDRPSFNNDECFLMLLDRNGEWRVNTVLKGFAKNVSGFASTYSSTGDIILLGKDKKDMAAAFERTKWLGGGIVLMEKGEVIAEISLPLMGGMSGKPLNELMEEEKHLTEKLRERGYSFEDPIYTLLFFSATHLPYIRVTQKGIVDVKKRNVLFPAIMRA